MWDINTFSPFKSSGFLFTETSQDARLRHPCCPKLYCRSGYKIPSTTSTSPRFPRSTKRQTCIFMNTNHSSFFFPNFERVSRYFFLFQISQFQIRTLEIRIRFLQGIKIGAVRRILNQRRFVEKIWFQIWCRVIVSCQFASIFIRIYFIWQGSGNSLRYFQRSFNNRVQKITHPVADKINTMHPSISSHLFENTPAEIPGQPGKLKKREPYTSPSISQCIN